MVRSGTTLNLLKFPILNPTPYRLFRRQQRLNAASQQTEAALPQEELRRLQHLGRKGYLVGERLSSWRPASTRPRVPVWISPSSGRVGRTFRSNIRMRREEIDFDPDSLSFGEDEETLPSGNQRCPTG